LLECKRKKLNEDYINRINLTKHQRLGRLINKFLEEKKEELNGVNMMIGDSTL
jgi:hypothetical protein